MLVTKILAQLGLRQQDAAAGSLRGRFVSGAFWSITGSAIGQGLGLVGAIIVARLLGAKVYGELGTIRQTFGMFGILAGFGLGYTATKYVAGYRTTDRDRAGRVWGAVDNTAITMSALAAVLILLLAPLLAEHALKAPHLAMALRLSAIVLVFNALIGVQNAVLVGMEAFRKTAEVELARGLLYLPVMVLGAYFWQLNGAVTGLGVVAVGAFIVGRFALGSVGRHQGIRLDRRGAKREIGVLWRFALPVFSSSMMLIVGEWLCVALLVRRPGGYVEMGLYAMAAQWIAMLEFIPFRLAGPSLSLLSNLYGERDIGRFRKLVWASFGLVSGFTLLAAGVVIGVAPWLMKLYGDDFVEGVIVLQVMAFMVMIRASGRVTSQVLMSMGRVRVELICSAIRISVQLLLLWSVFLSQGAVGLGLSMSVAFLIQLLLQGVVVLRILRRLERQWAVC